MLEIFRSLFAPPRDLILPIIAAWLGLVLAERRSHREGVSKEALNNLVFYGLIAFVISGRFFHALSHLPAYLASPLSLFSPNPDLFDLTGALVGTALIMLLLCRRQKIPILNALDALTPFFAVLAIGIGLMHLAAGTAFGRPSQLPWAIELWGQSRHPSQIYETLAALAILIILWFPVYRLRPGAFFFLFISFSAGIRLFLEAFRGDSIYLPGGVRQAQVAAFVILLLSFLAFEMIDRRRSNEESPNLSPNPS